MKFLAKVVGQKNSILVYIPRNVNLLGIQKGEMVEVTIKRSTGSTGNDPSR
jgi:hypothetical protein